MKECVNSFVVYLQPNIHRANHFFSPGCAKHSVLLCDSFFSFVHWALFCGHMVYLSFVQFVVAFSYQKIFFFFLRKKIDYVMLLLLLIFMTCLCDYFVSLSFGSHIFFAAVLLSLSGSLCHSFALFHDAPESKWWSENEIHRNSYVGLLFCVYYQAQSVEESLYFDLYSLFTFDYSLRVF